VALNLACANRAIILDLWWNHAVENQAFSRIWRFGQKKETHFSRIMCRQSIDGRLAKLQNKKKQMIERMLQNFGLVYAQMNEEDVGDLLGERYIDEHGVAQVRADYNDDETAAETDREQTADNNAMETQPQSHLR
jgi:hypothetical protein